MQLLKLIQHLLSQFFFCRDKIWKWPTMPPICLSKFDFPPEDANERFFPQIAIELRRWWWKNNDLSESWLIISLLRSFGVAGSITSHIATTYFGNANQFANEAQTSSNNTLNVDLLGVSSCLLHVPLILYEKVTLMKSIRKSFKKKMIFSVVFSSNKHL